MGPLSLVEPTHPRSRSAFVKEPRAFLVVTAAPPWSSALQRLASTTALPVLVVGHADPGGDARRAALLPEQPAAQRNLGYLSALRQGAEFLFEADDSSIPTRRWCIPPFRCSRHLVPGQRLVNAYRYFTEEPAWPRGYPLDAVRAAELPEVQEDRELRVGVWTGLVDADPDVDAVYRLTRPLPLFFRWRAPFALPRGSFCPFGSCNTWWQREAFAYLYLPGTVGGRFSDVLRSYVAQRLLWQDGLHLGFHGPTLQRERPSRSPMARFREELAGYLAVEEVVEALEAVQLGNNPCDNLVLAYEELARRALVSSEELPRVRAWAADVRELLTRQ